MTEHTAQEFFKALYRHVTDGDIDVRLIDKEGKVGTYLVKPEKLEASKWPTQKNCYFAVASRNGGRTKDHIKQIPALWCDIDFKDIPESEAKELILGFDIQPSAIVGSGGGYHAYWFLQPPLPGKAEVYDLELILRGIAERLHGDMQATDASRILRVPGTFNIKYDPARQVKILALDLQRVFSFSSLLAFKTTNIIYTNIASAVPTTEDGAWNFTKGHRDASLFNLANVMVKGGATPPKIKQIVEIAARCLCDPPFPENQIPVKIQSALNREERSEKTIIQEVREFIAVTEGFFRVTEVEQAVTRVTRSPKAVRVALHRLCRDGVIEKTNLPGCYSVIKKYKDAIHIDDVGEGAYFDDILLPMGLNRYVRLSPGNMVIVAGMTNSGKTGMLLNFIRDNMRHRCLYVTTEMSKEMTKERIRMFDDQLKWNFEIIDDWDEKGTNIVRPNDITLIDWLKAPKETFNLADKLDELHQKVEKGLLVVALQKNPGTMYPYGGYQTISKSALYLAMDLDGSSIVMKVGKAKAWASNENPYLLQCRFRFQRSVNIVMEEPWMFECEQTERKYEKVTRSKAK